MEMRPTLQTTSVVIWNVLLAVMQERHVELAMLDVALGAMLDVMVGVALAQLDVVPVQQYPQRYAAQNAVLDVTPAQEVVPPVAVAAMRVQLVEVDAGPAMRAPADAEPVAVDVGPAILVAVDVGPAILAAVAVDAVAVAATDRWRVLSLKMELLALTEPTHLCSSTTP